VNGRRAAAAALVSLAIVAGVLWLRPPRFRHVFVNETADHRFDESIQASILASYKRTGVQNAVVITDRFPSDELETRAHRLFRRLGLGRASKGRAILYLYSPAAKALKIEVGYALEPVMPDVQLHFLEEAAKTFTFSDRYQDFWAELLNTLNIEIQKREAGGRDPVDLSRFKFLSGGAGLTSRAYDVSAARLEDEMRRLPPSARADFRAGRSPSDSLAAYLASLRAGAGDEDLGVLSPASRVMRAVTPLTSYQLYRNAGMYDEAGLDELVADGDLAFAFFRPGHPVLPIVLRRSDGVWLVEEPLSWSLFQRFEDSNRVFLKYPLELGSAEGRRYLARAFGRPLYRGPALTTSALLAPALRRDPLRYSYFRLFWLERAARELERAPSDDQDRLSIALDVYENLGRFSKYLATMKRLKELRPEDRELARDYAYFESQLKLSGPSWRRTLD